MPTKKKKKTKVRKKTSKKVRKKTKVRKKINPIKLGLIKMLCFIISTY